MILAMSFSDIPFFVFQMMSTFQDEAPRLINRTFDFAMCCSLTPCCLGIITVVRGSQRSLKNGFLKSDLHKMMSPSPLAPRPSCYQYPPLMLSPTTLPTRSLTLIGLYTLYITNK